MKKIFTPLLVALALFFVVSISMVSCTKEVCTHDTAATTLTYQPANNNNEVMIYSHVPQEHNANFQEDPAAYWTSKGLPYEVRTILKFDFSVPANRTISHAYLSLYAVPNPLNGDLVHAHSGSDNAVLIQRITTNWNTATVSWNNQPSTTTNNQIVLPQTTDAFKNYINLDVTTMVKDMYSNGNYGMMLRLKDLSIYNIQNFASSKHANADLHPKLVIEYN